jgi:hypothetical protein
MNLLVLWLNLHYLKVNQVPIQPPFMPDMGIPSVEPEQPFVTGPTGVISYGTTEEGTPRLLTDYRTGETVYADTGEPYVPPTGEEEEAPIGPEEGIIVTQDMFMTLLLVLVLK